MKAKTKTDLAQLKAYFKGLNDGNFLALAPSSSRETQSAGHEDAAEAAAKRGLEPDEYSFVFWSDQVHKTVFNKAGNLTGPLHLHWGGEYEEVFAALANPPAGFTIEGKGEGSAFVVRAVAKKTGKKRSAKRVVRERIDAIYESHDEGGQIESDDAVWLMEILREGDISFLLECLNTLEYLDEAIPDDLILSATERVLKNTDKVVDATDEHTSVMGLKQLMKQLNRIDADDTLKTFFDAGMKSKNRALREAVAYGTQFVKTEHSAKIAGRLLKMKYPVDDTAIESYVVIRATLDEKSVAEVALELVNDWHKFPGCTHPKSMSLHPACLLIAARDLCDSVGFGYVLLALNEELPRKNRRHAFNEACECTLDANGVSELARAAAELKVAKKIVAQIGQWQTTAAKAGEECFIP